MMQMECQRMSNSGPAVQRHTLTPFAGAANEQSSLHCGVTTSGGNGHQQAESRYLVELAVGVAT